MRIIPINLANHVATSSGSLAYLLKITRKDGYTLAVTSSDTACTIDNILYTSTIGLNITSLESSSGFNVDNLELTTIDDGSTFIKSDIFNGLWRNASFNIYRYNFLNPTDGVEKIMSGIVGEIRLHKGKITAELRGLQQYFQQPIGSVTSNTCRARLGDINCTKDLTSFTFTNSVTSFTNNQTFTSTGLTQVDDFFGEGIIEWLTGNNTGAFQKIKQHTVGGNIVLMLPMFANIGIGDSFRVIAGCRKRTYDCINKYNNILNFQGEPHLPGTDALTQVT